MQSYTYDWQRKMAIHNSSNYAKHRKNINTIWEIRKNDVSKARTLQEIAEVSIITKLCSKIPQNAT